MIWQPPAVGTLGYLVGMKWPEGNEDQMWGLADDWRAAAKQLESIKSDVDDAISAVQLAYPQGDGGKEMIEQLKVLKYGGDGSAASLDGMIKWFDQIATMADGTGNEFEYTKLMFNATLIILAAELLAAAASLIFSPAVEAAEVAATRITVRFLIKRLLKYLAGHEAKWATAAEIKEALKNFAIYAAKLGLGAAIGAGLGAAPDAGIQAWQRYEGRREKFDWGEVGTMALAGGVGGLVGAPVGAGLKNVLGRTPLVKNTVGKVIAGGITTVGTGATAGLAGWGASALATGNTELDPRMITAGAVGGLGSGLLHSYKDARVPTVTDPAAAAPESPKPSSETPASQPAAQNGTNAHPASATDLKSDNAVRGGADTGNGQQLTNLQSTGGQAAPSPQNVGTPKASDVAQPANPARGAAPAEVKPAGTAAPRTETPHAATPPPETPKAGAAPKGDTGIGAAAQAKPTGIEAATPKVSDRAQVVQQEHGAGAPSEHPEKARPVDGNGAKHGDDNGAKHGDKPESRIGARSDEAGDHNGTGDKDRGNRAQPTDQTHGGDKDAQNHDKDAQNHDKDGRSHNEHDRPSSDPQQPHEHETPTPSEHPNRPVLPEDRPITDAERLHAQEALERLGHEDPSSLLHPENTDQAGAHNRARENHEWWHSLTDDQQDAMARVHPREIGNADGIPTPVRDQANRLSIARDMADLRENNPRVDKFMNRFFDPDGYREYKNLSKTVENLRLADKLADTYAQRNDGHRPPVRVLSYDARAFNGEGRAVVSFGDVDKASTVSYHIPGITTTVRSLKVNLNNSFNHFWETSRNTEDPGAVASIAWIGYDAPSGIPKIFKEMAHTDLAKRGGQLLARDVAAFNETRKMNAGLPDGAAVPDVHLFGHSYGSTTTSFAGAGGRLAGEVTTITLLGSPGAGPVPHASRFGIGDNVFVASSPRDPVTWIGSSHPDDISRAAPALGLGLGLDPSVDAFGGRRITAQFPGGIRTFSNIGTHTGYYKFHDGDFRSTPSESLYNFGKIAAGQSHEIIPEYPRPSRSDLGDFQRTFGSTPHDPAKFRSPEYELAEGPPHGYDEFVNEYRNPDPVADHTPQIPDEHRSPNDCGPQALQHVQELTGNPNIHVPDDPEIAHRGMSAEELENAAGAHMQPIDTPGVLADQLYRLGDGATAIVIDEYHGPVDDNGVGAHAYTITNDGGMLVIHDPALGEGPHPFPGDRANVANTHAIIYDSHGDPLHPHDSTADAHHSPSLPEARIGQPDSHPKLPVEDKPYYANPHYEDPRASQEYAAKNRLSDGEIQDIRAQKTANHPEIARLTDPELDVIRRNQSFHLNEPVNDATRNGNTQALHDRDVEIRTLISAYNKLPDHNGVVYRSLYIDDPVKLSRFLDDYQQGKTPVDHGFASSDKEGSMPGGNIEMIIDSRFGKDISWATGNQDEVVFPPGNKFLVKDHYPTTDRYGNPKYVIELQDLGRTDHEPGGIRPDSPASDAKPQTPLTGRPEVGGENPPAHGRPGDEGTPPSHGRPDQDLAGVGRIGDQSDQPRVGRDELVSERPVTAEGPDEFHKPFSLSNDADHPVAPEHQQEVPTAEAPKLEQAPINPDRPATLTPHLMDRFKELHERIYDTASAYGDPARATELPGLRRGVGDLMDRLGMLDRSTAITATRLFDEYHPELAKYLRENHEALLPTESDRQPVETAPQHDSPHLPGDHTPPADPLGHYADRTPAGLSLHNDPEMHALAHLVPEDPRFFTIDAHMTDRGTIMLDGHEYTMEQLAARLPELGYDGRPIRLIGCDAASTDAAARLAKATGTGVLAPTKPAWTDEAGHVYSSTAEVTPEGTRRPRIPPDGDWEFVHPDGTKVKVSEDGFVPGTREEDKHGVDPDQARARSDETSELSSAEGKSPKEIAQDRLKLANEYPKWFEDHYRKDGHRREAERLVDGHPLPQLKPDHEHPGKWILAEDAPPPLPKKFKAGPVDAPNGGVNHLPAETKKDLDAIAEVRRAAIDADLPHHERISDAKEIAAEAKKRAQEAKDALASAEEPSAAKKKEYDEAKAEHERAAKTLESLQEDHKAPHKEVTDRGEEIGEAAADLHAIPEHFPGAVRIELPELGYGQRQFDLVYKLPDGRIIVVEAKGPSAELGASTLPNGQRVQQGRLDYFESVLRAMRDRGDDLSNGESAIARMLGDALEDGQLEYVLVQAKANGDVYAGYDLKYFDLDKEAQPGGYQGSN